MSLSLSLWVTLSQLMSQAFSSLNNGWGEATYSQNSGGRRGGGTSPATAPTPPMGDKALHGPFPLSGPAGGEGSLCPLPAGPGRGSLAPQVLLPAEGLCGWGRGGSEGPPPLPALSRSRCAHTGCTNW